MFRFTGPKKKQNRHGLPQKLKAVFRGSVSLIGLLFVYITVVSLVSGFPLAREQFYQNWYFLIALAAGFGVQVGLYSYLKSLLKAQVTPSVVATTGTTSTFAMVSCCAHYLGNLLPVLGVTGVITVISQYQVQLFWIGLAFNLAGIIYLGRKVLIISKTYGE